MTDDRDVLNAALRPAMQYWEQWKRGKSLLGQYPPDETVLAPLTAAIERCEAYKSVEGQVLFTANSGVILHAPVLALHVLYRADHALWQGHDISQASDWLIRLLGTREADGVFRAAIWGISLEHEVLLADGARLMPFMESPDSPVKRRILERDRKPWDGSVWMAHNSFDIPRTAFLKKVRRFPYIRKDNESFAVLDQLEDEISELLILLQGKVVGHPLILGSWFEYEDQELDLKAFENWISWVLPEIVPRIPSFTSVSCEALLRDYSAFMALAGNWRTALTRSMERFIVSQSRRQLIDRVLDLCLAFEIAVSSTGNNAPPSWKVSVRSAQLIGGDLKERQERRNTISALYNLRNKGTHGSSLTSVELTKQQEILGEATRAYGDLLSALVGMSGPPDWNSIELQSPSVR